MWRVARNYTADHGWVALSIGGAIAILAFAWIIGAFASPTTTNMKLRQPRHGLYGGASLVQPSLTGLQDASATPPLQTFEALSPDQAVAANARVAFSDLPNPAARPFKLETASADDRARALTCLTMAVYYEAANQGPDGEAAVAQVVLNRVRNPLFPKSVCGVVFEGASLATGCQFTFTCDGALARRPSQAGWKQASQVAQRALDGYVQKSVGEATHYHTIWVAPYWRTSVVKLTQIGAHIFYRWSGGLGGPAAFQGQYAGAETAPPRIKGFDTGLAPAERAEDQTAPPRIAVAAPPERAATVAAAVQPVQLAMLTTDTPQAVIGAIQPVRERPGGYFGRPDGGGQHLPVPAHW